MNPRICTIVLVLAVASAVSVPASQAQVAGNTSQQLLASSDHHHGGGSGGTYVPPQTQIEYVPVKKTRWEEVEQEYYVEATDAVLYKVAPKKTSEITEVKILPDNFVKNAGTGEWAEGLSLSGEIQQRIEYDKDSEVDPANKFDPVSVQVQVFSSDQKRKSSVLNRTIDASAATFDRRADPNNAARMIETRTINLAMMAPIFIPYSSLRSVLFVGPRGTLMRMLVVEIALVDAFGNPIIGPAGPIVVRTPITINSFILPTWLPPTAPFPVFNPTVLITNMIIPMPWLPGWRPGGIRRPGRGGIRTTGRPPIRGTMQGGPAAPGTTQGGPAGPGTATATTAGQPTGPQPGVSTPPGGPGAGSGSGDTPPRLISGSGSVIVQATAVESTTVEVVVPAKKMVVYWFSLPEKEGNRHEVVLRMKNRSLGVGLVVLSVMPEDKVEEYRQSNELIDSLTYITEALETQKPVEFNTLDVSDQVSDIPFEKRKYILVFADPTDEDNLIDVEGLPSWAVKEVLENKSKPEKFETEFQVAVN